MKGRNPTAAEKRHMDKVASLGCIVCKWHHGVYSPAVIHHIDGKTKPEAHFNVLPLCPLHHNSKEDNEHYTSRHDFKNRFEARYGTEQELLGRVNELIQETT
jgi:hypothetical protein